MSSANPPPKLFAFQLALLVALTPFAIDTYLPAFTVMASELDIQVQAMGQTVSSYLLGFALGQLFGGPLSDRYGRKIIAGCGLVFFSLCALQIMHSDTLSELVLWRFLQALGGGFATVVVAAIVRDNYSGRDSATIFSMIGMIMMVAPLIAPAVGAAILALGNWQMIFGFLLAYSLLLLVVLAFYIPSGHPPNKSASSLIQHMWQGYTEVFRQRAALPHLIGQALISGILFTFITHAAYIMTDYYGVDTNRFALYFATIVTSIMLANRINIHLLKHYSRETILRAGCISQLLATVTLFLTVYHTTPSLVIIIALFMWIIGSIGFIYGNNQSLYLDHYPHHSGTANALFGCSTFLMGAILGSISTYMQSDTLLPIAATILLSSVLGSTFIVRHLSKSSAPSGV
ncbi:Bcr/CflA family multidrug efflux MFS transporter [Maricurvus nonylphenolicus]|uniref:multidrug effflux MFS transporter n=1 Tax=Maricurvus nonylphenolicus TaxID=1008307 RepID=UPI0036F36FCE